MAALVSLLFILFVSLLIVRIATEALTLTGLSRETARFQARSAWTGTGFTTTESEQVMSHPVRRRIISGLILMRNAGLVTMASTLVLSFVNIEDQSTGLMRILLLLGGLLGLFLLARSGWVERHLARLIAWSLKRYTTIDTRDYANLLHLAGEYAIVELPVRENGWIDKRPLRELELFEEGVLVLGVIRSSGEYLGAPRGAVVPVAGDRLLLYGRAHILDQLSKRSRDWTGATEHRVAKREQKQVEKTENLRQ